MKSLICYSKTQSSGPLKFTRILFVLSILLAHCVGAQELSAHHNHLVDSLKAQGMPVYIFIESCSGCAKVVGERQPAGTGKSCFYNEEYWIIWQDVTSQKVHSVVANNCFTWRPEVRDADSLLPAMFEEVFADSLQFRQSIANADSIPMVNARNFYVLRLVSADGEQRIVLPEIVPVNNEAPP